MSCCSTENQPTSCKIKASILTIILILVAVIIVANLKNQVVKASASIVDVAEEARLEVKARTEAEVAASFEIVVDGETAQVPPSVIFKQQAKQHLTNPKPVAVQTEAQKTTAAKLREIEAAKQKTNNPFSL